MTDNFTPRGTKEQYQRLSKEEYAAVKQKEKEAVFSLANETAKEIVTDPKKFQAFLDTQSRLDRYSATNALLIFKQFPKAYKLKNFEDWNKDNVKISKGEKSISILEPVEYEKKDGTTGIAYNVKKVFDISQTSAAKTPHQRRVQDIKTLMDMMLRSSPVLVKETDTLPDFNSAAFYDNQEEILYVKMDAYDDQEKIQSVAKALAHAQLSFNIEYYDKNEMDFQAGCVAYMLLKKYGIEAKDLEIKTLPDSLQNKGEAGIRSELTQNRRAMEDINDRISDELYKKNKERGRGFER